MARFLVTLDMGVIRQLLVQQAILRSRTGPGASDSCMATSCSSHKATLNSAENMLNTWLEKVELTIDMDNRRVS